MGKKTTTKKSASGFELISMKHSFDDEKEVVNGKKKYKPDGEVTGPASYEEMLEAADNFEGYLEILDNFAIIRGINPTTYKKAVKTVKKMIKLLRAGKGAEVYDEEAYYEVYNK